MLTDLPSKKFWMPKVYTIKGASWGVLLTALGFGAIGAFLFLSKAIQSFVSANEEAWVPYMYSFIFCLCGYLLYWSLNLPIEIKVKNEDTVEFRSILKQVVLSPHEIQSINFVYFPLKGSPTPGSDVDQLQIRHTKGLVTLLVISGGFLSFVSELLAKNPNIEIKSRLAKESWLGQ